MSGKPQALAWQDTFGNSKFSFASQVLEQSRVPQVLRGGSNRGKSDMGPLIGQSYFNVLGMLLYWFVCTPTTIGHHNVK